MTVIVVGGGIIGLASAYELAERGSNVMLLERNSVGAENSIRTGGGIRAQFGTEINVRLSKASIPVWESFAERFGVNPDYRRPGYLFLARTTETAAELRENVALQNDLGIESEYLDPESARKHCPGLHSENFVGAAYCGTDGYLDHHRAVQGYHEAALDAGVEIRTGSEVVDLQCRDGRVVGVDTPEESFKTDVVINAAGAWGGRIAGMAGLNIPIAPKRRQLLIVKPERPVPDDTAWTADLDAGAHFRPDSGGRALVGGIEDPDDSPVDPERYSHRHDAAWAEDVLERAAAVADYVSPATNILNGWAGLYAMTPDGHPILEESIPGLVNAVGFSGHGLMHAPAVGAVVAELTLDGTAETVDVSVLTADRFDGQNPLAEHTVF
ncbi:NAD(P)/FAD-dependent oxidoreductase [Halobacterium sp. KA-6]|uniref:NAD(P)/FAD-dependent oxidoreductase n=1 Tax=Halobacterium sp. KA-6 TaxID=2896368 RepID=UPI001E50D4CC|nr:FAD-dependent oxidoreductase [Halobacterium sp. KA-6]MCD2204597.1 FAD-binding oxidoreductase [Halobacterium sp. KA-6]